MSEYHISCIFPADKRAVKQLDELLTNEGIERDKNLDYTAGLYDDDYHLAATGSCFQNTLRCLAVDSAHQGEGLLNQVISHLIDHQYHLGNLNLFLYTKYDTSRFFSDLGFYEIARVDGTVVFMENRKTGFTDYLNRLKQETAQHSFFTSDPISSASIGAVIMNANPFTLGHQYLLETASLLCDILHVFIVSEDASLVPFAVRDRLVKEGAAHLNNLVFHQTGSYMISSATFPSYFLKDSDAIIRSHSSLDIELFKQIAGTLGITKRFVGEEPFSQVTGIYNQIMKEKLESAGMECFIIPRKSNADGAISASKVRQMIHDNLLIDLKDAVPESTYRFFTSLEAKPILEKIQNSAEVIHY